MKSGHIRAGLLASLLFLPGMTLAGPPVRAEQPGAEVKADRQRASLQAQIDVLLAELTSLYEGFGETGSELARERARVLLVHARSYAQIEARSSSLLARLSRPPAEESPSQRLQRAAEAEYQGAVRQLLGQQVRWLGTQLSNCAAQDQGRELCILGVVVVDVNVEDDFGPPKAPLGPHLPQAN